MKLALLFFLCLTFISTVFAERQPYERYQPIVERQMFGALPPGFDPTKMPSEVSKADQKQLTKEQEKLQSSIHFSVINVTPEGTTAVGFTDNSDPKTPVHYYLKVGEKRNGWEVKAADAAEATMTIAKGDIEVSLKIGGNSAKDAGATTKAGEAPAARSSGLLGGSLRAKRLQQREQRELAEQEKAQRDAEREAERQARAEEEKAKWDAERAEMNQKLQAITDSIKRDREEKKDAEEKKANEEPAGAEQNDAN